MKVIKVIYRCEEDGAWIGTSPAAPGYVGHGATREEARERVQEGLPHFLDEPDALIFHVTPVASDDETQSEGLKVTVGVTQAAPAATYSHSFSGSAT